MASTLQNTQELNYVGNVANNSSTWGEMVQNIKKEKNSLPWEPSQHEPTVRIGTVQRLLKQREFDPITIQYRDTAKEMEAKEKQQMKATAILSRVDELKKTKYNFIAQQGPPRIMDSQQRPERTTPGNRDWNLLSHLPSNDHPKASIFFDEKFYQDRAKKPFIPPKKPQREFNIVSNSFGENDALMKAKEYNQMKDYVLKKYWQTHDFDPVRSLYYDKEKEGNYQKQREVLRMTQGRAQTLRLPPSIYFSEGQTYNIVSHDVIDDTRFKATSATANRSLTKSMKTRATEEHLREEGNAKYNLEEERKLQRVSYMRHKYQVERGYNFITNDVADASTHLRQIRPATIWEKITVDSSNGENSASQAIDSGVAKRSIQTAPIPSPISVKPGSDTYNDSTHAYMMKPLSVPGAVKPSEVRDITKAGVKSAGVFETQLQHLDSGRLSLTASMNRRDHFQSFASPNASLSSSSVVPSLDLSKTAPLPAVHYVEPKGSDGFTNAQPVPMVPITAVRTGGFKK